MNELVFNPGDVVRLKSGGENMTVVPHTGGALGAGSYPNPINTIWYYNGEVKRGIFPASALLLVKEE